MDWLNERYSKEMSCSQHQIWEIDLFHQDVFCFFSDPHWASINIGIVLCKKCAGKIHMVMWLWSCQHVRGTPRFIVDTG